MTAHLRAHDAVFPHEVPTTTDSDHEPVLEPPPIANPRPTLRGRMIDYARQIATRRARERVDLLLAESGIRIDGPMPWHPRIRNDRAFRRVLRDGMVGVGESYVDGDWDCDALDELSARFARVGLDDIVSAIPRGIADKLVGRLSAHRRAARIVANGRALYDRGDDLYSATLGPTMVYGCGRWDRAATLDDAQHAQLELVCARLELRSGHNLLDLGCGYGELARHAAATRNVRVVGLTSSHEQAQHARKRCAGLPVQIVEADARQLHGRFDRISAVGILDHLAIHNFQPFFERVNKLLAPDGLFLFHVIGNGRNSRAFDPWIDRYIAPGATLPSALHITRALEGRLVIEDWQNFATDCDRTLMAWSANFERAWPALQHYGQRFYRLWRYFLLGSAGAFRARRNQAWQLVLSRA